MSDITRNSQEAWIEKLWEVIQFYKEESMANQDKTALEAIQELQEEHDDLNTIMAWLREDLGLPDEMEVEKSKEQKLDINNTLFLSTSHLPKHLGSTSNNGDCYMKGEFSFILTVGSKEYGEFEESLNNCIDFAVERGCQYICFDRDANIIDQLETYDW